MLLDRATLSEIEKEAKKVLPFLEGKKHFTALLKCEKFFVEYGWEVAGANSKIDGIDAIRKDVVTFFNRLDSSAFKVRVLDVTDMHVLLRRSK